MLEESPQVDPEDVPAGGSHSGHLLRLPADGAHAGRPGRRPRRRIPPGSTARPSPITTPAASCSRACPEQAISWMSHGDYMAKVPEGFALVAHTDACPNAAICRREPGLLRRSVPPGGESHRSSARQMLRNFLYEVCGAKGTWTMGDYLQKCRGTAPGHGRPQGPGAAGAVRRRGFLRCWRRCWPKR